MRNYVLKTGFLRISTFVLLVPLVSAHRIDIEHNRPASRYLLKQDEKEYLPFRLWACSDSHIDKDLNPPGYIDNAMPRESLAEAIRQSEGTNNDGAPPFDWDIALHLGDSFQTAGCRLPGH